MARRRAATEGAGWGGPPRSRRQFLGSAARATLAAAVGLPRLARAAPGSTLRIAQWAHFVPGYDEWFDQTFVRQWGERNGVTVTVDHLSVSELRARAAGEIAARRGHDLFGFVEPPSGLEVYATPLGDVVGECERRFGRLHALARQASFDPRSGQHFAFCDSWAPMPLHYRTDWWGEVGVKPDTWDAVREGARRIREKRGMPAGFGLAPENDSNMVLRGLLWSFGAAEQDERGGVTINSRATVEAIKLMTAIYKESMTSDVLMWDPASNNRFFVWGRGSIIANAISALRQAEKQNPEVARQTALAPAPAGPAARLMGANVLHSYVLWKFAESPELARRFLVDLVAAAPAAFQASEFYNLPSFSGAVPDLASRLAADKHNPRAYALLADARAWSAGPGYPGYPTPAVEETVSRGIIPRMFARAARGQATAEESARQAEVEMKRIFGRFAR